MVKTASAGTFSVWMSGVEATLAARDRGDAGARSGQHAHAERAQQQAAARDERLPAVADGGSRGAAAGGGAAGDPDAAQARRAGERGGGWRRLRRCRHRGARDPGRPRAGRAPACAARCVPPGCPPCLPSGVRKPCVGTCFSPSHVRKRCDRRYAGVRRRRARGRAGCAARLLVRVAREGWRPAPPCGVLWVAMAVIMSFRLQARGGLT